MRPLKQASSHISDTYEDDFEPTGSTAPGSPSILSPTSPPGTAAAVVPARPTGVSGGLATYSYSRQVGNSAASDSNSGHLQLRQQQAVTTAVAKAGAQVCLQAGLKRVTSAGVGDRDLPDIQEGEECDLAAEQSTAQESHINSSSSGGVRLHRQSSSAQHAVSSWRGGVQFEDIADLSLPVVIQRSDSYAESFASAAQVASEHSVGSSISSAAAARGSGAQQYVPSFVTAQQRGGDRSGVVAVMSAVLPRNVRHRTPTPTFSAAAPTAAAASKATAPESYHSDGVLSQQQSLSEQGSSGGSNDASVDGEESESAAAGSTNQQRLQQQAQQQHQRVSSNASSLDSDLSDLLAELSASRASRMGSKREASAPGAGTFNVAAPAAAPGSSAAARAAAAAAVGLLSGRGAASATHHQQQQQAQQQATAGGRRLSSYSEVSLFSDDDEALAGARAKPTSAGTAVAVVFSGHSSAVGGKAGGSTAGTAGGARQLRGARVSGDSRYSSFSMDESDIEIDYDELASLGIDVNAPAPAAAAARGQAVTAGNSWPQQQQQQARPVTAHGLGGGTAAAGVSQQQKGVQRPGTSYGLPPKPQQYQQQQQYVVNRQPGAVRAVSAGSPVGAVGGAGVYEQHVPAKANAASVFYGHVSGSPVSTSSNAGRSVLRGY